MQLVALLESPQDRDGALHARLADEDLLEPALKGRILLDVLVVLVKGRRADAVELAAGKGGLEHIAGVKRAVCLAGAYDGMDLVDEEYDLALLLLELVEDSLKPLLELAAVLGACDEPAHVKGEKPLALEPLGNLLVDDSLGQALDNRGLADARLADEDRVVLGPSLENLHGAPDLLIAADDRIERALLGLRRNVNAELGECAPLLLGVLIVNAVAVSHLIDCLPDLIVVKAVLLHDLTESVTVKAGRKDEELR